MHFKRLSILLISLIFIISPIAGDMFCYADDTSNFESLRQQSDLVKAFQYYCKSRDLTIEGSVADGVTTFTTSTFNSLCNSLGINVSQLQAELSAEYDGSGNVVKFLYNASGINSFNRIFAQFLQDNDLSVGDSADQENNTLYSGVTFLDYYNNLYLATTTIYNNSSSAGSDKAYSINPTSIWLGNPVNNYGTSVFSNLLNDSSIPDGNYNSLPSYIVYTNSGNSNTRTLTGNNLAPYKSTITNEVTRSIILANSNGDCYGYYGIVYKPSDGHFYFCVISYDKTKNKYATSWLYNSYIYPKNNVSESCVIYLTTNNTVINNNTYEGDTIINNEGDIINNNPNPDPDQPAGGTPPSWDIGGGEGQATDGNGNTWNITFPDFELPDLNIDWSISGLGDKFPFSIPFDMVALITALSAEPEAPHFEGTIDFGFTDWDYDIDLQPFDSVAAACRIAELLLLVFGLILITRQIIKG